MKTGIYKTCEKCTKPFYCYPYNSDKRRFCSTSCSNKTTNIQQMETKRKNSFNKVTKWRYSHAYKVWRSKCLVRDNYICQSCNKDVSKNNMAVVHHPKSWNDHPELRYDINNGQTLCRSCHNIIHVLPSRKVNKGF